MRPLRCPLHPAGTAALSSQFPFASLTHALSAHTRQLGRVQNSVRSLRDWVDPLAVEPPEVPQEHRMTRSCGWTLWR